MRRLIVNADDLGLTAGVNRGILAGHLGGVISSTTLMAGSHAFANAVELVRARPGLSVGCHVVLVDGAPLLETTAVPSLLNGGSPTSGFPSQISVFARRALTGRLDRDQLASEIVAQIRHVQKAGVEVSHLDTHKHTHIFPVVLDALLRAARICDVPAIRNPAVPVRAMRGLIAANHSLWKRYAQVHLLRWFTASVKEKIVRAGLRTPDGVIGVVETGSFESSLLRHVLENLPDGTWELVCHPGYSDADLQAIRTRLRDSREEELRLLMSSELKDFLSRRGIQIISYRELV